MLTVGTRLTDIGRTNVLAFTRMCRNVLSSRRYSEAAGGTTVNIMNSEPDAPLMVDSYSQIGFRLNNGLAILGPMVIFPKTVLSWNVGDAGDITADSLSLFFILEPKVDILVIGLGERGHRLSTSAFQELRRCGINVEMLPTDAACATFNFLNAEKRSVAGALIPPKFFDVTVNDLIDTKLRRSKFIQLSDELDKT